MDMVNMVALSGTIVKRTDVSTSSGEPVVRLLVNTRHGTFSVIVYGWKRVQGLDADVNDIVFISGFLRQRTVNGREMVEVMATFVGRLGAMERTAV